MIGRCWGVQKVQNVSLSAVALVSSILLPGGGAIKIPWVATANPSVLSQLSL